MSKFPKENSIETRIKDGLTSFLSEKGFTKSYISKDEIILVKGEYTTIPRNTPITNNQILDILKDTNSSLSTFISYIEEFGDFESASLLRKVKKETYNFDDVKYVQIREEENKTSSK